MPLIAVSATDINDFFHRENYSYLAQNKGILTDGEGSVQYTSSLR